MCEFFSLISNGRGKIFYFDKDIRSKIKNGKLCYEYDSHSSIASYFKVDEDKFNKWEYNPITKKLIQDRLNTKDDYSQIQIFCDNLDFKTIVPELNIKKIIHPFEDFDRKRVTKEDRQLLKKWASVRASVRDSVGDSVRDSVGASVWASVGDSVRDSVWASVEDSVWASVRASVWASVGASVRDSVWAYIGSMFKLNEWRYIKHKKNEYPFECLVQLWENGLVPSFDGKIYRLHGGKDTRILFEIEKTKLM
jgi:hypothetical protein